MDRDQLIRLWKGKMDKNFMTPELIKFITWNDQVIEISQGTGFSDDRIFGMTHRKFNPKNQKFEDAGLSRMFQNRNLLENVANIIKATDGCSVPKSSYEKDICNKLKKDQPIDGKTTPKALYEELYGEKL